MSNRVTVDQVITMPIGEVSDLPAGQLEMLVADIEALKNHAKKLDDWIGGALMLKYADKAEAVRAEQNKAVGTVRFDDPGDDDYEVVSELDKKVEWDQAKLAAMVPVVEGWCRENPDDRLESYLQVKKTYSVPELAYVNWPKPLKDQFTPARTVKPGKAKYKIVKKGDK
ncbi:MAG: hypothetical protein GC191_08930 [Azospirillum sp.]|nr:hypothetical protein [Azospirillum sp.]